MTQHADSWDEVLRLTDIAWHRYAALPLFGFDRARGPDESVVGEFSRDAQGRMRLDGVWPVPRLGEVYLWDDYYVRVTGAQPHARGYQVQFYLIGLARFDSAGLSEFMRFAQHQPKRY